MPTVLVLTAHGDDMEFFAGGTIAKLCSLGYEVHLVIATDNARGTFELTAEQCDDQQATTPTETESVPTTETTETTETTTTETTTTETTPTDTATTETIPTTPPTNEGGNSGGTGPGE